MSLLEEICSGKYNLVFMIIVIVLLFYLFNIVNKKKVEKMSNVNRDEIRRLIYDTYRIDINSINNLIEIANKIQTGGLTHPGNLTVSGDVTSNGNVTTSGTITGTEISRVGTDWFRINHHTDSSGQTGVYGNLSINTTKKGKGGLSVGNFTSPGNGNISATGNIIADGNIRGTDITCGTITSSGNVKGNNLCIGETCIDENQLKVLKGEHAITFKSRRDNTRLMNSAPCAGFDSTDRNLWEQFFIEPM
jgi:cytoskeletal protein CcmA (bactofilin family)